MAVARMKPVLNYANDNYVEGDIISFETKNGNDYWCVKIERIDIEAGAIEIIGEEIETINIDDILD